MSIYKQYDLPLECEAESDSHGTASKPAVAVREQDILEEALAILERRHQRGATLSCPADTMRFLRLRLAAEPREIFGCIFLDNRHRVIVLVDLFFGTIDGAPVFPREIVKLALEHNAAALVVYHNHPSGVTVPSQADIHLTGRIREALQLLDIRLIDHLVVSAEGATSLAELGLL